MTCITLHWSKPSQAPPESRGGKLYSNPWRRSGKVTLSTEERVGQEIGLWSPLDKPPQSPTSRNTSSKIMRRPILFKNVHSLCCPQQSEVRQHEKVITGEGKGISKTEGAENHVPQEWWVDDTDRNKMFWRENGTQSWKQRLGTDGRKVIWFGRRENAGRVMMVPDSGGPPIPCFRIQTGQVALHDWAARVEKWKLFWRWWTRSSPFYGRWPTLQK